MRTRLLAAAAASLAVFALAPGTASAVVTVQSAIPFSGVEGEEIDNQRVVNFDDAGDAAGRCTVANYALQVDWGDGTTGALEIDKPIKINPGAVPGECSYAARGTHTYERAGVYDVSATICPAGGACSTTPIPGTATIREADFRGEAHPLTATAGTAFSGLVAELKDDNRFSHSGDFAATVDWGDGTAPSAGTIAGDAGNFTIDAGHTYAAPGGYRIAVSVVHGGRTLVLDPQTITVNPGPSNGGGPGDDGQTTTAPTATVRVLGGRVTLRGLRRNGLRLRIGVSNTSARRLLVRLRDARSGRALWSRRVSLAGTQVHNGQRTADLRLRIPRAVLNRLRHGRSYGISFPRQSGLPSFGTAFRLR
ncbi:MAG TPA: hypothetical protein VGJ32_01300 [Solirubrobacteraceae bacterium]|jgi:hypothetical protein